MSPWYEKAVAAISIKGVTGVTSELLDVPGVTTAMLVAFEKHGIRSIEDLAGCATDDLEGWSERKGDKTVRYAGILDRFKLSRGQCEAIIINARIKIGWIKESA